VLFGFNYLRRETNRKKETRPPLDKEKGRGKEASYVRRASWVERPNLHGRVLLNSEEKGKSIGRSMFYLPNAENLKRKKDRSKPVVR